jgi:dehydrogenase/reductase SDR family protein 7
MSMILWILLFIGVAIFIVMDADVLLYFLPSPPPLANAGQVVWIVGASSGIGASLALDYARDGAKVIISARRVQQLEDLAKNCVAIGGEQPLVLPFDITKYDEHNAAFNKILETYGHLDVLVMIAGLYQRNTALDSDFSVTETIMNLNFLSYVALNKVVLPHFIARNEGKIVVMSSSSGVIPTPVSTSYSASKFALVSIPSLSP